ncbi:MAG: sensor histidine kinase [Candidatus Kapaibacteriota bacterium]
MKFKILYLTLFTIIFNTISLKSDDLGEIVNFMNKVNMVHGQIIKNITSKEDTLKLFIDAAYESQYIDPRIALKIINYGNSILNPNNYDTNDINSNDLKYKGKILSIKANMHFILWEFDSCYYYYSQSKYYRLKTNDIYERIWAYNNITTYFNRVGQIDSSLYYLKKALLILNNQTKGINYNYLNSKTYKLNINKVNYDFGYLNTYRELIVNYSEAVANLELYDKFQIINRFRDISKLFVKLGFSSKKSQAHDLDYSNKYFNLYFTINANTNLYDQENINFYNSFIESGYIDGYRGNKNEFNNYITFDKLIFLRLIPEIIENPSKIKQYKEPKPRIYLNPLEKYLHKIVQIKRDIKDENEIKRLVLAEIKEIFFKLSYLQKSYVILVTSDLFKKEFPDKYLIRLYYKHIFFKEASFQITDTNKSEIYSTILLYDEYHRNIFENVQKINKETFNGLITLIVIFSIVLIIIFILLFRNIKLVKKNKEINQQLQDRNAINQKIYEVISHDLGGPISNLQLYSQLTKDNIVAGNIEKSIKNVDTISNLSGFLNNTLETLLNYLKFDNYKVILNKSEVDLNDIITEIEIISSEMINRKKIKLIRSGLDKIIHTDPIILTIILRNLIQNSIKFSPVNSEIIVEISEDTKNTKLYKISVIDFGTGISPDRRVKILKGVPINAGIDTENKQSTAFGFLIIRDLTHKLGGEFDIQDNTPKGTIVTITIPK